MQQISKLLHLSDNLGFSIFTVSAFHTNGYHGKCALLRRELDDIIGRGL